MRNPFVKTLLILAFFCSTCLSARETSSYIYTNIGHHDGLINTVCSIYKSVGKDVWIGTDKGLYKYDGFNMRYYDDPVINGVRIHQLATDTLDRIWACTEAGALRYDPLKDTFVKVGVRGEEYSGNVFSCVVSEGRMYFGGTGRIWEYDSVKDEMSLSFRTDEHFSFMMMHPLEDGLMLCTGHQGLKTLDMVKREEVLPAGELASLKSIFASLVDEEGNIWISEYNEGVKVYARDGALVKSYTEDNGLSCNVVLSMTAKGSEIWIGTDGGGINIIDGMGSPVDVIRHNIADKSSLPANSIKSLHVDSHGSVWAGSVRDGLINIRISRMRTVPDGFIGYNYGLSNPTVLTVFQENDSKEIWIGTDGEGVNRFDQSTGLIYHYQTTYGTKVVSIASYSDTHLLLSVYSKGLYLFNKRTGEMTVLEPSDKGLARQMMHMGRSVNLVNEHDGSILLLGNEIYRWDKSSQMPVLLNINEGHYFSDFFLPVLSESEITYVHDSHNLYTIRPGSGDAVLLTAMDGVSINSAFCDEENVIWMATNVGLVRYDMLSYEKEFIETTLFSSAVSVVKDSKDRVWIGSGNKLFAYLSNDGVFAQFGDSDGALPNEYIGKSSLVSNEENVFMGGVQGLLYIDRDFSIDRKEKPVVYLSDCVIDGQSVLVDRNRVLKVPKGCKTIEMIVATEEKDLFREKRYRYKIDGVIEQTYESSSPELILRPIPPPGRHQIFASCMTRGGEWTEPELMFSFKIPQVWYKSWWFILLCLSFCVLLAGVGFAVYVSQMKHKNELDMKEREKKAYEDKVNFLVNWGNELKTPLTLVMAPLKRVIGGVSGSDDLHSTVRMAYRQAKRVQESLNVMLNLKDMEEGKSELDIRRYNFNEWVSAAAADFIAESAAQNVKITEILDSKIGEIGFDKKKCTMALSQIMMNSISLSSPNDVIFLSTSARNNGYVRVSLSGSGDSSADIDVENIFSTSGGSTVGVGLSYAKILVELHGGSVGAFNNERAGMTVWFEIPTDLQPECVKMESKAYIDELMGNSPQGAEKDVMESLNYDTRRTRLMLIDDSRELMDFMKKALEADFAEIQTASSGAAAMKMMEDNLPDIIVCDVNMPNGNGYEFCSTLRLNPKYNHIPVILLTTKHETQSSLYSSKVGADGMLDKPFEIDALYEMIRNQLKRKADMQKNRNYAEEENLYGHQEETFIAKIDKTIAENISNPELGVEVLCRSVGISRSVLYNKLKMITGVGANEYISRIRIEKAIFLIENTEMTFTEIADKIGMTPNYFSTSFKQYTGKTPTQYKKSRQTVKK